MKDICLIVYDECHHARKFHPYNCIMREFYFNSEYKPKILGLTACPTTGIYCHHDCIDTYVKYTYHDCLLPTHAVITGA